MCEGCDAIKHSSGDAECAGGDELDLRGEIRATNKNLGSASR